MRLSDAVDARNVEQIADSLDKYGFSGPAHPREVARWLRAQGPDIDTPVAETKRAERERRPSQAAFRTAVLTAYEGRCAITGCDVPSALEAAHVADWRTENDAGAGILLRVDLHRLLESGLLAFDASYRVVEVPAWYGELRGPTASSPGQSAPLAAVAARTLERQERQRTARVSSGHQTGGAPFVEGRRRQHQPGGLRAHEAGAPIVEGRIATPRARRGGARSVAREWAPGR